MKNLICQPYYWRLDGGGIEWTSGLEIFIKFSPCNERYRVTNESINEKDEGTPGAGDAASWKSWSNEGAFKNSVGPFGSRNVSTKERERERDKTVPFYSSNNNSILVP